MLHGSILNVGSSTHSGYLTKVRNCADAEKITAHD
jgi:hypothetical protein